VAAAGGIAFGATPRADARAAGVGGGVKGVRE
jgi:hypothetical protein